MQAEFLSHFLLTCSSSVSKRAYFSPNSRISTTKWQAVHRCVPDAFLLVVAYPQGEYSIFLCGPQAMYNFVDKEIATLGLRRKFIRHELFGEYFGPAKEADYPKDVAPEFKLTVRIAGHEQTITAPADTSLLRTMEAAGIAAPAHCRSGECGWCHSRLVSGDVYIPEDADGRRAADKKFGWIHPCCSYPVSDVTVDVPVIG